MAFDPLDTHYAATEERVVGPYHGRWHQEGPDSLSGLSPRSFWLTVKDLVLVLMENGFLLRYILDLGDLEKDRMWLRYFSRSSPPDGRRSKVGGADSEFRGSVVEPELGRVQQCPNQLL